MATDLESVHLLFTYRCDRECDHCFVWASPSLQATMSIGMVRELLTQASEIDSVKMIYFEGGEPFLFYPTLLEGVKTARSMGFDVGIVTNGYWGVSVEDARLCLSPLAEMEIADLSISDDELHRMSPEDIRARNVVEAAKDLGMPVSVLEVCKPRPAVESDGSLFFRGRASEKLAPDNSVRDAALLKSCPEDLARPSRVHVDPLGLVHVCQGITIGDTRLRRLSDIIGRYRASEHPVISCLVDGGPSALVRRYDLRLPIDRFADDCHLCYEARIALRSLFPECLGPDEMYGVE